MFYDFTVPLKWRGKLKSKNCGVVVVQNRCTAECSAIIIHLGYLVALQNLLIKWNIGSH